MTGKGYMTYGEEDITPIHDHHNQTPNPCKIEEVARAHESNGDDMMGQHLVVIFSTCFSVEDQDLMRVERGLREVVEFEGACEGQVGVTQPGICRV